MFDKVCSQQSQSLVNLAKLKSYGITEDKILPQYASIMPLHMKSPNLVPLVCDLVANFVNSIGNIWGSIPVPVSYADKSLLIIIIYKAYFGIYFS